KIFLTLTGYFLIKDIDYYKILLDFRPVSRSYTSKNLIIIILLVLYKHNLFYRLLDITTNNTSNNNLIFSIILFKLRT
ncbi:uncharacterized protein BO95DRAFT_372169, partial [Aspergillus brunneoviolaceus CBS 621.78]